MEKKATGVQKVYKVQKVYLENKEKTEIGVRQDRLAHRVTLARQALRVRKG